MRISDRKLRPHRGRGASIVINGSRAIILGAIAFVSFPNLVAYQDIAGLVNRDTPNRWLANITAAPGQSVIETAALADSSTSNGANDGKVEHRLPAGVDPVVTGSVGKYTFNTKPKKALPQTINRAIKGDRVVSSTIKRPPAHFSAGTVVERHSLLDPREMDPKVELAFVEPKPAMEALKVAAAFHRPEKAKPKIDPNLPVMVAELVTNSKDFVMGYAPEKKAKMRSPFAAVLNDPVADAPMSITPRLNKLDHAWAASPLPKSSFSAKEQSCLARGIYFEARGEPAKGQAAVSQVILNRVRNPTYPNTICGVVYQNRHWRNRCQFSFACDRIADRINNKRLWNQAKMIAKETTAGRIWLPQVGSATHYHATYVNPRWARTMQRVGKIGLHIFYRTYGGGWS